MPPPPLAPLLSAFDRARRPAEPTPRSRAAAEAALVWLRPAPVAEWSDAALGTAVAEFHRAAVPGTPLPNLALGAASRLRHALSHWLHGAETAASKLDHCLEAGGPFAVGGLGRAFWSAIAEALSPTPVLPWSPAAERGLARLGFLPASKPGDRFGPRWSKFAQMGARLSGERPDWSPADWADFLSRVAFLAARELPAGEWREPALSDVLPDLVRRLRTGRPSKPFARDRSAELAEARRLLEAALAADSHADVRAALALVDPTAATTVTDEALDAGLAAWGPDLPARAWDESCVERAGVWLPAALLHLWDAHAFPLWDEPARRGLAALEDGVLLAESHAEGYALYAEAVGELASRLALHRLEVPALLARVHDAARRPPFRDPPASANRDAAAFAGFASETFAFLGELAVNNNREWMTAQRERYAFFVREPLAELAAALAARYVAPVLVGEHGWDLETDARPGKVLSSVVRNDFGRGEPYHSTQWLAFYRKSVGGKRDDVQFFVRLDPSGVACGLRLGRAAREAGRRFRQAVQEHADALFRALESRGGAEGLAFTPHDGAKPVPVERAADLRAWAVGKAPAVEASWPADALLLRRDDLVGAILLVFDRLLPVYACAADADPVPRLAKWAGERAKTFDDRAFRQATGLRSEWLARVRQLLTMKRQLILYGVPGTGKTFVARQLARHLSGDRPEAVRLVQFHPATGYEEFVEGIRPTSVVIDGRAQVTYPVEDGVLVAFAREAQSKPEQTFVLVIDEINRGNLPRIFGELLYLLEYRDEAVILPTSKRSFRLPANLVVLGTMNGADRSTVALDQALRRRFSFCEMQPDAAILAEWLMRHPPAAGDAFAARLIGLFEELNARLERDFGPDARVGHSLLMLPGLDEPTLRAVWEHHVRPLLDDVAARHPGRAVPGWDDVWRAGGGARARR